MEPFGKQVTFESLLITPIQRIPRYQLLLKDLYMHTADDHPDLNDIGAAVKLIQGVANHINSTMKQIQNSKRLANEGFAVPSSPPHRYLSRLTAVLVVQLPWADADHGNGDGNVSPTFSSRPFVSLTHVSVWLPPGLPASPVVTELCELWDSSSSCCSTMCSFMWR